MYDGVQALCLDIAGLHLLIGIIWRENEDSHNTR